MKNQLLIVAALTTLLALPALAQNAGSPQAGYISVMSKAGTPTPRPSVPVRYVPLPVGARAGVYYYYGNGGYGYGGSPSPSYANQPNPSSSSGLPGYDTRPQSGDSSRLDAFGYSTSKRRLR